MENIDGIIGRNLIVIRYGAKFGDIPTNLYQVEIEEKLWHNMNVDVYDFSKNLLYSNFTWQNSIKKNILNTIKDGKYRNNF